MAVDRLVPTSATPGVVRGDAYMDAVQEELTGLWNIAQIFLSNVGGSANVITADISPPLTSGLGHGMGFYLVPLLTNTGPVTLNATSVVDKDGAALASGALIGARRYLLVFDSSLSKLVVLTEIGSSNVTRMLHVQDQKANGTDGGTFNTGAYRTRVLNTVLTNEITGASLASSQITLPAGTYYLEAFASCGGVGNNKLRIRNITDTATLLVGQNNSLAAGSGGVNQISGRVTLASAKVLELQHICAASLATTGFGVAMTAGDVEVYSEVKIWKIS